MSNNGNGHLSAYQKRLLKVIDTELDKCGSTVNSLSKEIKPLSVQQSWDAGEHGSDMHNRDMARFSSRRLIAKCENLRRAREQLLTDPEYGICGTCEKPIDPERLIEIPFAKHCFPCKTGNGNKPRNHESHVLSGRSPAH